VRAVSPAVAAIGAASPELIVGGADVA